MTYGSPSENNRHVLHRNAKVDLIKRAPLFARCTRKELDQVAHVADEIDLREGKELTVEGQPGREFFVLIEGTADVRRKGRKINEMKGGDFFGAKGTPQRSSRPRRRFPSSTHLHGGASRTLRRR